MTVLSWPKGVAQAKRHAHLIGTTQGEMLASLVARIVHLTAQESLKACALVALDDDGGLVIEPVENSRAEFIATRFPQWVVGTYSIKSTAGQIEEDLCGRLAEVKAKRRGIA